MNRVVLTIIGLGVIGGGGAAAAHYYGQEYARSQIVDALAQLDRAGVRTEYAALDVSGFPLPSTGTARDLEVFIPNRGWRFTLPEVSADVSVTALDQIVFRLPDEITVEVTDESGTPTGMVLRVKGEDIEAIVGSEEADVYDFALNAATARIEPELDGAAMGGALDLDEFKVTSRVEVQRADSTASGQVSFDAASATFSAPEESPEGAPMLQLVDVSGSGEANLGKVAVNLKAGSAELSGDTGADVTVERFEADVSVSPKEQFDLTPLFALNDAADVPQALVIISAKSIAEGGAYDQDISVGSLKINVAEIPDPDIDSFSVDATDFNYDIDIAPSILGVGIEAGQMIVDLKGADDLYYDIKEVEIGVAANAAEDGFDLSPLAVAGPTFAEQLLDIIRLEVIEGGDAVFTFKSTAYSSTAQVSDPNLPITSVASSTGPGETSLALTSETLSLTSSATDTSIQVAGGIAGRIDAADGLMELSVPVQASEEPQPASLKYTLGEVTIDDQLWAMMDPSGALDHSVQGAKIDVEMALTVAAGLLTNPEAYAAPFPPVIPGPVTINDVTLEMLGAKAAATGSLLVLPTMTGAVDVRLLGWEQLIEGMTATPLGQDPNFGTTLLIAQGFIEQFGVPGDVEGETKMDVAFNGPEITINGQSLAPPPPPAPEEQPAEQAPEQGDGALPNNSAPEQ